MFDVTCQGKGFGAFAFFGAHGSVPVGTFQDNLRYIGIGFHVVDVCRFSPQTADSREGRAWTGFTAFSFNGCHQRGFLTANKCSCTHPDFEIEGKIGPKNILSQQPHFPCLLDAQPQRADGNWVFSPAVDISLVAANCVSSNCHSLNHSMRIAFQNAAVHECTRITLIRVADEVLGGSSRGAGKRPFFGSGETCTTPATQTGFHDFIDHIFRRHFCQHFCKCHVPVFGNIIFNVLRIDLAAITKDDPDFLWGGST